MALALVILTLLLGLVPLLLLFFRLSALNRVIVKGIIPMAGLIFFASCYESFASLLLHINPSVWFRVYLLLDFMAIYYFFKTVFLQKFKIIFILFAILYALVWVGLWLIWNPVNSIATDAYLTLIESVFVYTFAVFWFKDLFNKAIVESLWHTPTFYFICGLIFYFSGTIFLFLLSGSMLKHSEVSFEKYWLVNVVISFILRLLLSIGIWKSQKLNQHFG